MKFRPRFGVMRSREFIMKDAYSFHADQTSLQQTYDVMYDTYAVSLPSWSRFPPCWTDTGSIGGSVRMNFMYWLQAVKMIC